MENTLLLRSLIDDSGQLDSTPLLSIRNQDNPHKRAPDDDYSGLGARNRFQAKGAGVP